MRNIFKRRLPGVQPVVNWADHDEMVRKAVEQAIVAPSAIDESQLAQPEPIVKASPNVDPAYHLNTVREIVGALDRSEALIIQQKADEERRHADEMARLEGQLENTRKTAAAYRAAATILDPDAVFIDQELTEPTIKQMEDAGMIPAAAVKPATRRRPARPGRRETFEVPDGFEAVKDADGKATGEVRPILPTE